MGGAFSAPARHASRTSDARSLSFSALATADHHHHFAQGILLLWLALREPSTLVEQWSRPKIVMLTSLVSCLGSLGWFTAMSLESVALVKTQGQVEVLLFALAIFSHQVSGKTGVPCVILA